MDDFRDEVLVHVDHLKDEWADWLALLAASDVVEGVFRINQPEEIRHRPEEYLDAHIESPRILLGRPQTGDRTLTVFNTSTRRWGYSPVYSRDLERCNGRRCVVFLNDGHVLDSAEGRILPITPVVDLGRRECRLRSFLHLAKLDAVQVAHLVSKPDSRVNDVVEDLCAARGDRDAVQSCYDELRTLGANALPGILHELTEMLLRRESNPDLAIEWVFDQRHMNPETSFDLLHCRAGHLVRLGPPPKDDVARWRDVRIVALHLLAASRRLPGRGPVGRAGADDQHPKSAGGLLERATRATLREDLHLEVTVDPSGVVALVRSYLERRPSGDEKPSRRRAQGKDLSERAKEAVETWAVQRAIEAFPELNLEDAGSCRSWDLEDASSSPPVRIEVKGSSLPLNQAMLTQNEVRHAEEAKAEMGVRLIPVVVEQIELRRGDGEDEWFAAGGTVRVWGPWEIESSRLEPTQWRSRWSSAVPFPSEWNADAASPESHS